jgi:hypothetical protein
VSVKGAEGLDDAGLIRRLESLPNESIYDGTRLAQPDEVWNYGRGDGLERALCFSNVWKARHPGEPLKLVSRGGRVHIAAGPLRLDWPTAKGLERDVTL